MKRVLFSALVVLVGFGSARGNEPDLVRRQIELIRANMHLSIDMIGERAKNGGGVDTLIWQNEQIRRVSEEAHAAIRRLANGPVKPPATSPQKPLLVGAWRSVTRDANGVTWVRDLAIDQNYLYILSITAVAPNGAAVPQSMSKGGVSYYEDGVAYLTSFKGTSQRSHVQWHNNNQFTFTTPGANVSYYQRMQ